MVTQLSILTAVRQGHVEALRDVVSALPVGAGSPFASVEGTHNGRWVVVSPRPLVPHAMLMCSATFDGPIRPWVESLLTVLGPTADGIWSHCAGWPGRATAADYLCAHRVQPDLAFATWDAPVSAIRESLALRTRLVRFAVRTQGFTPEALLDAYRAEFAR